MSDNQDPNPGLPISNVRQLVKQLRALNQVCARSFQHKYLCDRIECIPMKPSLAGHNGNTTKYLLISLLGMLLALELRYANGYANIELF